jgi:lipopolysaccharide biosynthesis regulator YciM
MAAVSFYRRRPGDIQKYAAEAYKLLPGDAESGIWLSNWKVLQGDYPSAKNLMHEILQQDPLYFPARMNLAYIMQEEGDIAGAVRESEKMLEQNPYVTNCINTLALAYLDGGSTDKARAALNRARQEDRGNYQIRIVWSLLLAKEGKAIEAHQELDDRVQRWASLVPYATLWAVETYSELGEIALALDWLERAVRGGDRRLQWFRHDPYLANIRNHPRFEQILVSATRDRP